MGSSRWRACDWGVDEVDVSGAEVAEGRVIVTRFTGVFPGGARVSFDRRASDPTSGRSFEAHFAPELARLGVVLAVADGATGSLDAASIRFETESAEGFETIRIAEIVRDATGVCALRDDFVPPIRRVGASPWLTARFGRLRDRYALHHADLAEDIGALRTPDDPPDLVSWRRFEAYSELLAVLDHLIAYDDTDPEHAYVLLCQFAGRLSSHWRGADWKMLPRFDRADLSGSLGGSMVELMRFLPMSRRARYVRIHLETREDGLHFGRLDDERLRHGSDGSAYILQLRSNLPETQTAEQMPVIAKVGSWSDIAHLVATSNAGVELEATDAPPQLPRRIGAVTFTLRQTGPCWQRVEGERTIAIYLPPPYDPQQIELQLYALRPDTT